MRVATLRKHPSDPDFVLLGVGSELNPVMGRFEPARLSTQHRAYLVHISDLDALGRFLRIHDVAVADERNSGNTGAAPRYAAKPFACLKCECGYTQRECEEDCDHCGRCHQCGSANLWAHTVLPDEQQEINRRGLAKVKPQLQRWPMHVDQDPPPDEMEGAA